VAWVGTGKALELVKTANIFFFPIKPGGDILDLIW